MKAILVLGFAAFLTGCSAPRATIQPAGPATAVSGPSGLSMVRVVQVDGAPWSTVEVWSHGLQAPDKDGSAKGVPAETFLHVGFRVSNNGTAPVRLDATSATVSLRADRGADRVLRAPRAGEENGPVAPGGDRRLDLYFPVPADITASSIDSFVVSWALERSGDRAMERSTFARGAETGAPPGSSPDPGGTTRPNDPSVGQPPPDQFHSGWHSLLGEIRFGPSPEDSVH